MPGRDADCLFCKIVAGDIPAEIVHSTERTVAFRDINAQAPLHVLVVPRQHHANAVELAAADPQTSAELITTAAAVARAASGVRRRLVRMGSMMPVGRLSVRCAPPVSRGRSVTIL